MTKATTTETKERTFQACQLLARKIPAAQIKVELAKEHGISIKQAGNIVKKAEGLLYESLKRDDIRAIFLSTFEMLQEDRLDAQQAGNHCAQVGASKQLVKLISLLPSIDQQTVWETEHDQLYDAFIEEKLAPPKGTITLGEKISMKDVGRKDLKDIPMPDQFDIDEKPF